jgi:hypothetical protein
VVRSALAKLGAPISELPLPSEPPSSHVPDEPAGRMSPLPENVILRAGQQRRSVLEAIARATASEGSASPRAVAQETGLRVDRVLNVILDDSKRLLVEKRGEGVAMTEAGFHFLRQLGSRLPELTGQNGKAPEA